MSYDIGRHYDIVTWQWQGDEISGSNLSTEPFHPVIGHWTQPASQPGSQANPSGCQVTNEAHWKLERNKNIQPTSCLLTPLSSLANFIANIRSTNRGHLLGVKFCKTDFLFCCWKTSWSDYSQASLAVLIQQAGRIFRKMIWWWGGSPTVWNWRNDTNINCQSYDWDLGQNQISSFCETTRNFIEKYKPQLEQVFVRGFSFKYLKFHCWGQF